ncbi:unnamed protein product [Bemisia tabaci]|uniref:tryptophan--tRNA ligase n=1 Tax=Bemisia tabaci TaxID=7038 RepID=A0A9P0AJ56_BEMTA|nr:unnamed protein product [Bemisia tabaci]
MVSVLRRTPRWVSSCSTEFHFRELWRSYSSEESKKWKDLIFSGVQPTGTLHIGNYFGAVKKWVEFQNEGKNGIYCIVDLHAITVPKKPEELKESILKMASTLIACGIDPSKSILFQQSQVPYHAMLGWIFICNSTMSRLAQLPHFKEKTEALQEIPAGLFAYPTLQAADILLYKATHVPVGNDQLQNINLACHLVNHFNKKYGNTFPRPQALMIEGLGSSIKSLRDPAKKMAKSSPDPKSRIDITDSPDEIRKKCRKAVTDCTSEIFYEPATRPGVSNMIQIHSSCTGLSIQETCDNFANKDTLVLKDSLADVLIEKLSPIREEIERLQNSPEYIHKILSEGATKAMTIAKPNWLEIKKKVGFS